ncbi:hypothetical protein L2D08_21045 [Domibacillus sp. PGB-M46]|uniref:hypothetical protein n=1 Tax=Domibacillus sp. PGB-M46 TaxID=2910255 RepID=UPI001F5A1497|nr:hypothetical protein [Domibacillus sp. PGB-M46]MCI2256824.1 hypothetical protein [Domibacillus sp. PGB-M46]
MPNHALPNQTFMNPGDVCSMLNLKKSAVDDYAAVLKNAGYPFHVNPKGERLYFHKDVIVMKRFMEVKKNQHLTVEQAANEVVSWAKDNDMAGIVIEKENAEQQNSDEIQDLKETIEKQNELLQELSAKLDRQPQPRKSSETKKTAAPLQDKKKSNKSIFDLFSKKE